MPKPLSMTLACPCRVAGADDFYGTAMDEVVPAYSDRFLLLMTHPRHGGIFTPWERRTKLPYRTSGASREAGAFCSSSSSHRQNPNRRIPMRPPSVPLPQIPRLTRQLRRLQQAHRALGASAQDTALLWKLCAPSRSRRH